MIDESLGLPGSPWRERALIFNTQPVCYLHASWFAILPHGDLVRRLRDAPRTLSALSRYLLQTLELEGRYVEDFTNPWARLALLDGLLLERLLRRLGLTLCAPLIRRELTGPAVRHLKQSLGEEDWAFVMTETPLLGPIPHFEGDVPLRSAEPAAHLALIGARYCALHGLSAQDVALTRRLALKLPVNWRAVWNVEQTSPSPSTLPLLLRKLLRDLPLTWTPLFD